MTPEDFVALAMAEDLQSGRAGYGYSMRVASGNPAPPGCIALTWIAGKDASERDRIRDHARQNRLWVRCPSCASLLDADDDPRTCPDCGADLPERPLFW